MKPKIGQHWFNTISYKEVVDLRIKFRDGVLQIFFPKERIQVSSIRIFAFWITVPAILMIAIAIIFLKNQTRPIIKLAEASEKFGRGENIEELRQIARTPPELTYRLARSIDVEEAEAILLVCTDLPTINIINQLEDAIGKPVITSNQASFWATIRSMGLQENTTEFGRLLAEH